MKKCLNLLRNAKKRSSRFGRKPYLTRKSLNSPVETTLINVFVVYDTKYDNTKTAAEAIVEGLGRVEGIQTSIGYVKEIDMENLADNDVIVLGAPNHMGRPSRTMKKFVEKLAKSGLKAKHAAVFGTYSGRIRTVDRAVRKMERIVEKQLPGLRLVSPSLSIRVRGVTGPIVEGERPKCIDFGTKIADQLMGK